VAVTASAVEFAMLMSVALASVKVAISSVEVALPPMFVEFSSSSVALASPPGESVASAVESGSTVAVAVTIWAVKLETSSATPLVKCGSKVERTSSWAGWIRTVCWPA
jgi:hypothetical protein